MSFEGTGGTGGMGGTGGVVDVDGYLGSRVGLHRRIGLKAFARNSASILDLLDTRDLDAFFSHFHEHARFRFGSQEAVCGKQNIIAHVRGFLDSVLRMQHAVKKEVVSDDLIVVIGDVVYEMANGKSARLPFCDTWKLTSDFLIIDYQVFSDPTPLA